jgi:hypothetical protein
LATGLVNLLFPLFRAIRKNIGRNLLWTDGPPVYLNVPLIAEKRPPQFVGYFDLDPELSFCVVIPFAHVRDSRKNHREREDDQPS